MIPKKGKFRIIFVIVLEDLSKKSERFLVSLIILGSNIRSSFVNKQFPVGLI